MPRHELTGHRSGVEGDVNDDVSVAFDGDCYSVRERDAVVSSNMPKVDLRFCAARRDRGHPAVLTSEVLVAVLTHRLEAFQGGEHACKENDEVLGHLYAARDALFARTERLRKEGNAVKDAEESEGAKQRPLVTKNDAYLVFAGDGTPVMLATLASWSGWGNVERAVRRLYRNGKRLSEADMELIRGCAVTDAGKHGLKEVEQAIAQMG